MSISIILPSKTEDVQPRGLNEGKPSNVNKEGCCDGKDKEFSEEVTSMKIFTLRHSHLLI
jgi:hypothetical protein